MFLKDMVCGKNFSYLIALSNLPEVINKHRQSVLSINQSINR